MQALKKKDPYKDNGSYWNRFGYEIGGPVCYAYVKWISDIIDERNDVTGIAFVARDGWLLKKIYEKMQHKRKVPCCYVYAPRALVRVTRDPNKASDYKKYIESFKLGDGTVAVVDTVTMKFSSQFLIDNALDNDTLGLYWVVLNKTSERSRVYDYISYQKKDHHTIRAWDLMEYIMTSPESPVADIQDGQPVFKTPSLFEKERMKTFSEIEKGVLEFADHLLTKYRKEKGQTDPFFDNRSITEWVNDFLKHPSEEDVIAFRDVTISKLDDHSDKTLLDPFGTSKRWFSFENVKERLWFLGQKNLLLYKILRSGYGALYNVKIHLKAIECDRFDGSDPESFAEKLLTYDVVSFDIFDTLIRRPFRRPTDLFWKLEKQNGLNKFHDNRIRAEADARSLAGENSEVDIYAIYELLAKQYGFDPHEMAQKEIEEEIKVCYPDEKLLKLYNIIREKGKKMIAVSDMYLPSRILHEMLDKCGYTEIEQIFVSCEYGVGKGSGGLQLIVQSKLGDKNRYVHIGDNIKGDVWGSKITGWGAVWYRKKG